MIYELDDEYFGEVKLAMDGMAWNTTHWGSYGQTDSKKSRKHPFGLIRMNLIVIKTISSGYGNGAMMIRIFR
jgi:hypothetical protein